MRLIDLQTIFSKKQHITNRYLDIKVIKEKYIFVANCLDTINYRLLKEKNSLLYNVSESPKKALDMIKSYEEELQKLQDKSHELIKAKLIYEFQELKNEIRNKSFDDINVIIEHFPKTISNLKHSYYLKLKPQLKRDYRVIECIKEKLQNTTITTLHSAKDILRVGDIIVHVNLSNREGRVAKLINLFTRSLISHVSVYTGDMQVIEASRTTVQKVKLYDHIGQVLLVLRPNITDSQKKQLVDILHSKLGKRYSKKELLGHLSFRLFKVYLPKLKDDTAYFCSELVDESLKAIGISISSNSKSQLTTPSDIAESKYLREVCLIDGIDEETKENTNFGEVIKNTQAILKQFEK